MISLQGRIEKKLDFLSETELDEVLDFVEFLIKRKGSDLSSSQKDPLLAIAHNLTIIMMQF